MFVLIAALLATSASGSPAPAQASQVAHLVQTNLPQSMEYPANWDALHAGDMSELDRISIAAGQKDHGLVVWPEVPAPFSLIQADFAGLVVQGVQKAGFLMQVDPNMNHGAWLLSLKAHSLVRESKPSAIPILSSGRICTPAIPPPLVSES